MSKAKPCPFCGGEPEVFFLHEGEHPRKWEIACRGHEMPDGYMHCPVNAFTFGATFDEAVEKWNRRAE